MEINDLIKSNLFLISVYVGLILLIALIIYIVRNQAKKKALNNIDIEPDDMDLDDNEGIVSIQKLKDKDKILDTDNSVIFADRFKGRFIIVNEAEEKTDLNNSNNKHENEFNEIYEATASKLMFKFNLRPKETIEE